MAEGRGAGPEAPYLATTYRVQTPHELIDIRVGRPCARLDALLMLHRTLQWAFITAWNPGSRLQPDAWNAAAHQRLLQELESRSLAFHCAVGIPDEPGWTPERSVWVAGISRREALELGVQFGQNAIVVGTAGGAAELLDCRRA